MKHEIPIIILFACTFGAFLLLALATFSVPLSSLYFLYSSEAGGVRFGVWGWCIDEYGICLSPLQLGYTWEPEISGRITNALVFYPIAAILTLLSLISFIPVSCDRTPRNEKVSLFFVLSSFLSSFVAFIFMIGIWNIAKRRLQNRGFDASFGPLPWMSLAATLVLLVVTLILWYSITSRPPRALEYNTNSGPRRHRERRSKARQ